MTATQGSVQGVPAHWVVGRKDCLLVVDVQRDFTRGGSLEVADGDAVVPLVNQVARLFVNVVVTQDWHTPAHASFASQHPGRQPFETIEMPYGTQVLWPDHCVQGTPGAALHEDLDLPHAQLILRKGFHPRIDSYSVFLEADRRTHTGLSGYLALRGVDRVFIAGLATDFCVAWSAIDARRFGFGAVVLEDACRAIDSNGSLAAAWSSMLAAGVQRGSTDRLQAEPMNSAPPM
jgi:nicotinamidase/pyrazinamidase